MPSIPSSDATVPAKPPSTLWLRCGQVLLRVALALLLVGASLLLGAWLILQWGILPRIEQWRPQIEARASTELGLAVHIGNIAVTNSSGWRPVVELRDVVLADTQGHEALRLPRVVASVSPASLLEWQLRFEQLLIDSPHLEAHRDASGRIYIAGIDFARGGEDSGAGANWFFSQREFLIRKGSITWTDDKRHAAPLSLSDVDLSVRNHPGLGVRHHEIRLDATPPEAWGQRFSLRGSFTQPYIGAGGVQRAGQWQRWRGTAYAELPHADVQSLRQYVDLPFELNSGRGSLRAWVELRDGNLTTATADVALREVTLKLGTDLAPLDFARLDGRVIAERSRNGYALSARKLGFATSDGIAWPASDFSLHWREAADGSVNGGELSADRLDLAALAKLGGRMPLGAPLHRALAELAPQGLVAPLAARWEGPLDAPARYSLQANLRGLSLAAQALPPGWAASGAVAAAAPAPVASAAQRSPQRGEWLGRPGLHNADIVLNATERGGQASLGITKGSLELPGVFDDPAIALDSLAAQLAWTIQPGAKGAPSQIELKVGAARFANADAEGELQAAWRTGAQAADRLPGLLDLSGKLSRARVASVARYLPLGIPEPTRRYVEQAALSGNASSTSFKVKGDLRDFPFGPGTKPGTPGGDFRIAAQIDNARFAYVPGENGAPSAWPIFTQLKGELVFDRDSMEIRNAQARLGETGSGGFELSKVNGGIKNLAHEPALVLDGQGRGPLADALRYVATSPIDGWIGHALARATASGNTDLRLALSLPLNHIADSTVKGSVSLAGNDVRLRPDLPLLAGTQARIEFTQRDFSLRGGRASTLGGNISFEGARQADGALRFTSQGVASAEGLRRAGELGSLAALGAHMSGQTPYQLKLGFPKGRTEFSLSSSLVGLGLNLPAPLRKPAGEAMPLRMQLAALPAEPSAPALDRLSVELGSLLQTQYQRDVSGEQPRVLRGSLALGLAADEAAPLPVSGVAASVKLPSLNVDAWQKLLDELQPSADDGKTAAAADPPAGGAYLPTQMALRAKELIVNGRKLDNVVAGITHDTRREDSYWRANLEADQLSGYAEYRQPRHGEESGRIYARLARLALPRSEVEAVESLLEQSPRSVPALDIVVDDLDLRGKRLGRVEIEATNQRAADARADGAAAREWRLSKLNFSTPEAKFAATGYWSAPGAAEPQGGQGGSGTSRRRAVMNFKLDLADSGGFLARMGLPGTLRGGKGKMSGQVSWLGSPLSPDYPSLAGNVNLAIESGQFLKADPGIAKLLGVLSLQSLPRRLLFDFRDVFLDGFSFDGVNGDVAIANGVASTRNLRMRGVQAVVLMEGQADIAHETQDLRVWVVPEINAGAASLAYAVINPAVGLGTFLGQLFLRKPLIEASTREFAVSGSWADPKVERIERKAGDAMPKTEPEPEPEAAPAAPEPAASEPSAPAAAEPAASAASGGAMSTGEKTP